MKHDILLSCLMCYTALVDTKYHTMGDFLSFDNSAMALAEN